MTYHLMSYAVMSVHPPTKIVGGAGVTGDVCVVCRGNELVCMKAHSCGLEPLNSFRIFGDIARVVSVGERLFVLLSSEVLLCMRVSAEMALTCDFKCGFGKKVGKKVDKPLLSASETMVAVHTRVRTCYLMNVVDEISFPVLLPYEEMYDIACRGNVLMVLGKTFSGKLEMSVFDVNWSVPQANKVKSITIHKSVGSVRSCFWCSDDSFVVSVDKTVFVFDREHNMTQLESAVDVRCLCVVNSRMIGFDLEGAVDLNDGQRILRVPETTELCYLCSGLYLQLSSTCDAHVIKFDDVSGRIFDTYAQLIGSSMISRTHFLTGNGQLRKLVNGSATSKEVQVKVSGGINVWGLESLELIVLSTYTSTHVFNRDFEAVEHWLKREVRSICVVEVACGVCQVTEHRIVLDGNVIWETAEEITLCTVFKGVIALCLSSRVIEVLSIEQNSVNPVSRLELTKDVSAMAICSDRLFLAYWDRPTVHTFALPDAIPGETFDVDTLLISSMIYSPSHGLIIGGFGSVFHNEQKIPVSNSSVLLRQVRNDIIIVSDVCSFLQDGHVSIFDTPLQPLDIAPYGAKGLVVLNQDSFYIVTPESDYHTHVEDERILNHKISSFAIDEKNDCPLVYAAKKGESYYIVSSSLPTVKLNVTEVPNVMMWVYYKHAKYLVIGMRDGSKGKLLVLNIRLERVTDAYLSDSIDAMTYVNNDDDNNKFLAVASSTSLLLYDFDDDMNLRQRAQVSTRLKCASLTSPNSCAIVYADQYASVIIYTAIDGQLAELYRDYNPKGLRFARLESETDILAVGMNSALYCITIEKQGRLSTTSAFDIGAASSAVLNAPDLAFLTRSGSSQVIFKGDADLKKIFKAMTPRVKDAAGLTIADYRTVFSNGKPFPFGDFVDGDFLLMFDTLSDSEKQTIATASKMTIADIQSKLQQLCERLNEYRKHTQNCR